jgi:tRNA threonylcarbamoyladenosine biosynthesis protein TsaB
VNTSLPILAIDTATEALAVGLQADGRVHEINLTAGRTHSQRLQHALDELMTAAGIHPAELGAVVCGIGPGSFAGVRIGVSFCKGLSLALDLPLIAVSSLDALAMGALAEVQDGECVLACIDARMGEVYWACYQRKADDLQRMAGPGICAPEQVSMPPAGCIGVGSGFALPELTARALVQHSDPKALPQAIDYLRLGRQRFIAGELVTADDLVPLYLRDRVALTTAQRELGETL